MFFDALTMACVAGELRATILGGRVQQALLPDPLSVGLEIYAGHRRRFLLASAHAETCRLVLASDKLRRGSDTETGLLVLVRKYLRGSVLSAIEQPPFERVLRVTFDHPEWGASALVVEIMGRHSNVVLVGAGNRVLDAVKRVGPKVSAVRPLLPGQTYAPPPPQAKLAPSDLTDYQLQQMLAGSEPGAQLWQVLVAGLKGISPLLAREIAFRAVGHPGATVGQAESVAPVCEKISGLLSPLETGQWQPSVVVEEGRVVAYAPYPVTQRGQSEPVQSMSEAVERYTSAVAPAPLRVGGWRDIDPYAAARRPVRQAIVEARTRFERRREALERAQDQADGADRLREWGKWILTYAHTIIPGQTELVADMGDGDLLRIPLDPDRSPADNAQAYFTGYRKGQRAGEGGPTRLEEVDLALRDLEQLETDLDLAPSRPEIDAVREALAEAGYVRLGRKKAFKASQTGPLSVTSPDGLTILIGRNSRQNDEVTFRRAEGDDWWFHAHGVPGAHVIVRAGDRDLPPATIQRAAELAAYFSRLRGEAQAQVDYARRRHVRRIPGAAPGLVTYSRELTIRVAPRGLETDAQPFVQCEGRA